VNFMGKGGLMAKFNRILEMVRFPLMIKKYFVQNELEFGIL